MEPALPHRRNSFERSSSSPPRVLSPSRDPALEKRCGNPVSACSRPDIGWISSPGSRYQFDQTDIISTDCGGYRAVGLTMVFRPGWCSPGLFLIGKLQASSKGREKFRTDSSGFLLLFYIFGSRQVCCSCVCNSKEFLLKKLIRLLFINHRGKRDNS